MNSSDAFEHDTPPLNRFATVFGGGNSNNTGSVKTPLPRFNCTTHLPSQRFYFMVKQAVYNKRHHWRFWMPPKLSWTFVEIFNLGIAHGDYFQENQKGKGGGGGERGIEDSYGFLRCLHT